MVATALTTNTSAMTLSFRHQTPSRSPTTKATSFYSSSPTLSKPDRGSRLTKEHFSPPKAREHPQIRQLIDLVKACEETGSLKQANCIHGHVLNLGFDDRDLVVFLNHAAHVYSKCMDYDSARKVFDGMHQKNVFSWTVMIVASNEHGYYLDGLELFCMMLEQGVYSNA